MTVPLLDETDKALLRAFMLSHQPSIEAKVAGRLSAEAAGPGCAQCLSDYGPHPWHDDGTPGPGREAWQQGGRYAPPERVD